MKNRIVIFALVSAFTAINTITSISASQTNISRIDAVTALLDTVVRISDPNYVSWNDCYTDDGKGGYNINMADRTDYALIYALYPHLSPAPFSDLSGMTQNQRIALFLGYNSQIVCGYGDNSFKPNDYLTYAQAIKMIVWSCSFGFLYKGIEQPIDFYSIALDNNISDSEPIHQLVNNQHKMSDYMSASDFNLMLDTLSSNITRVFTAFHKPQSYLECAELFAKSNTDNPYLQYPLLSDSLINAYALQRDEYVLSGRDVINKTPYINYLLYDIKEISDGAVGMEKCFEISFSSTTNTANIKPVRYLVIDFIDKEYKIVDII